MKKKILPLLLFIAVTTKANAQNWLSYSYDAAGNRIYRLTATIRANRQTRAMADSISIAGDSKFQVKFDKGNTIVKIEITSWDDSMQGNISIYDLTGREIHSVSMSSQVSTIDLSRLGRGTYILSVSLNGETWNRKFNK